jgi:hypothetical protein
VPLPLECGVPGGLDGALRPSHIKKYRLDKGESSKGYFSQAMKRQLMNQARTNARAKEP